MLFIKKKYIKSLIFLKVNNKVLDVKILIFLVKIELFNSILFNFVYQIIYQICDNMVKIFKEGIMFFLVGVILVEWDNGRRYDY